MPCRSYEDEPRTIVRSDPKVLAKLAKLDALTRENCLLREALLKVPRDHVSWTVRRLIEMNQVEHRKEDLARLKDTFRLTGDFDRFERCVLADPNEPLEPQLGFDPDAF